VFTFTYLQDNFNREVHLFSAVHSNSNSIWQFGKSLSLGQLPLSIVHDRRSNSNKMHWISQTWK